MTSGNVLNLILKTEQLLGFLPSGWNKAGIINIDYGNINLTTGQINTLNTGIKSDAGMPPVGTGTRYIISDIMDFRQTFKARAASLNTTIDLGWSGSSDYVLQFKNRLTPAQKTTLNTIFTGLFKMIQL